MLSSNEIRSRFLEFFKERGHAVLRSAPLLTENTGESTNATLFNTAGMQPLIPYLLGKDHPDGKRLVNVQKCVRTVDLEEVGDATHLTFFEMLGNWSLGDYFKKDAIKWSYLFLTDEEKGLGLDPKRLYVTVFAGNDTVSKDTEAAEIWESVGVPKNRIYWKSSKSNWWTAGPNSPAGPSTEMFYDLTGTLGDMNQKQFEIAEEAQQVVEIWNDVFMAYKQENGIVVGELPQKNVDTGAGLERITAVVQEKNSVYETDLFALAKENLEAKTLPLINNLSKEQYLHSSRIIFDHLRTALMLTSDGVIPSNKEQGYILRRLIRRSVIHIQKYYKKTPHDVILPILDSYVQIYKNLYPEVQKVKEQGFNVITSEVQKFLETLHNGLNEFEKGADPFVLATTYGFPIELTLELAKEKGKLIDLDDFNKKMIEHQKLSQTASAGMFKGGLANHEPKTIKLHTAHHLLLAALQKVLGKEVKQRGSNITEERLRIDFTFDRKMTDEEKKEVEAIVNDDIKRGLTVVRKELAREEAEKIGAEMEFGAKYPDMVSVYFIEDENGNPISKEFCGGPHVANTGDLASVREPEGHPKGNFKIQKEEASSQGVRRIKAILTD